jgi:hypothetical protein
VQLIEPARQEAGKRAGTKLAGVLARRFFGPPSGVGSGGSTRISAGAHGASFPVPLTHAATDLFE